MRLLHKLGRRLRLLMAPGSVERELDEEMQSHLREAARDFERQGYAPAEAERAARLAFGGLEATKENARDAWGGRILRDLIGDGRYALYQAVRAPLHTAAVVILLGAAVAGASLALTLARAYLLRPLPYPEAGRLVSILPAPSRDQFDLIPDLSAVDWEPGARLFATTSAWDLDGFTVVGAGGPPEMVGGSWVSSGFFTLLGIEPALGRGFDAREYVEGSNVALISDGLWRRRFGQDPGIVGTSVRMHATDRPDQDALVTIVGVLPPRAWDLHRFTDVLRPLSGPRMFSLARLPHGVEASDAAARLTALVRAQVPSADSAWRMSIIPTQEEYAFEIRPVLLVLVGAALLLLLLAQASTGALLLARASARLRELNVRRALGATRGRLVRQLVTEAGLTGLLALIAGLAITPVLARVAARSFETFGRIAVPGGIESVGLELPVLLTVFVVAALPYGLLAISPVLRLASESSGGGLSRSTPPPSVARMRRGLVALQVSVAVVLLAQGALLVRSSRNMLRAELGFDESSLLKGYILLPRTQYPDSASKRLAMSQLVDRIRQVPEVVDAAVGHPHPFRGAPALPYECEGCTAGGIESRAVETVVTPGWFTTLRIPLVAGRLFDARDNAETQPVAVVSEALSRRLWNTADGTGRRLRRAGDRPGEWLTVIGVVGEVRKTYTDSLHPDVYLPLEQAPRAFGTVMVRTRTDPLALEPRIRAAAASADPTLALAEVEPMASMLRDRRGPSRVLAGFVGGVAVLGFTLTVLGLAAVVGYLVRLRRREFAVRMTLGARPGQIVQQVFRDAGSMLGIGLSLGLALAWGLAGWSRAVLAGISPRDPLTYGAVVLLVVVVALGALLVPATRAALVDPSLSLREDQGG